MTDTDNEFNSALEIILHKIADDPTRLNQLSHDILRKVILCVGKLDLHQKVTINGTSCKLGKLITAMEDQHMVNVFACDQCGFVEISDRSHQISVCRRRECDQIVCVSCSHACLCSTDCASRICNGCWPKSSHGYCSPCDDYEDTDCMYCYKLQSSYD